MKTTRVKFDLAKAVNAPFCHYFLRLGIAVNDLLSIHQFGRLDQQEVTEEVRSGMRLYLMKTLASHVAEAYISFVENIGSNRKDDKELTKYIESFESLKPQLTELRRVLKSSEFLKVRKLRDSFGFHYNYKKNGNRTMQAALALLKLEDKLVSI